MQSRKLQDEHTTRCRDSSIANQALVTYNSECESDLEYDFSLLKTYR